LINDTRNQIERYEYLQRKLLSETPVFQDDYAGILTACKERDAESTLKSCDIFIVQEKY
jgi:hypothetical protein